MIAYMSAPLAVVPLLLLTAFFPSSIKASLEHMRSTPSAMPWLDPVNFYLGLAAKGMAIAYLSLLLRDRVSSSVRTADAVLRKAKSLPLSPPDELRPPKDGHDVVDDRSVAAPHAGEVEAAADDGVALDQQQVGDVSGLARTPGGDQ